jgi:hypothetical protein
MHALLTKRVDLSLFFLKFLPTNFILFLITSRFFNNQNCHFFFFFFFCSEKLKISAMRKLKKPLSYILLFLLQTPQNKRQAIDFFFFFFEQIESLHSLVE